MDVQCRVPSQTESCALILMAGDHCRAIAKKPCRPQSSMEQLTWHRRPSSLGASAAIR